MFKSKCEYLLKRCDRSDYEELMDELLDLFWDVARRRIGAEELLYNEVVDVLWLFHFERMVEHLIWGWYPGKKTFSERYGGFDVETKT